MEHELLDNYTAAMVPTAFNLLSGTPFNISHSPHIEEGVCHTVDHRLVSKAEIVACVISILTVLENCAILTAIVKGPGSLRKPPYWFIASLASADLMTGIEVVLAIFVPVGNSPSSRIVLKGLAVVTFIVSINSLLFVSLDRYLRIKHYTDYDRILTRRNIIFLIALSWFLSILLFLIFPLLGIWSCASQHCCADNGLCVCRRSKYAGCSTICSQSFVPFSKQYIMSGSIYFLFSIVCMVMFYFFLFKAVKKRTFGRSRKTSRDDKQKIRDLRLAKTLIITIGVFVICWLPSVALFVADFVISEPRPELAKIFDYALVPSVINSFLNPIIYSIRLPRMRNTLKLLFLPCFYDGKQSRNSRSLATNTTMRRSTKKVRNQEELRKHCHDNSSSYSSGKLKQACCTQTKATCFKGQLSEESSNMLSSVSPPISTAAKT